MDEPHEGDKEMTAPHATSAPPADLSPSALMAQASAKTGLADWGDDHAFVDALNRLIDACAAPARLTPGGWQVLGRLLRRHLRNRLHLQAYQRAHPETRHRALGRPIVVTGLPRTGTTLTHQLLAQDRRHRFLPLWQALHPIPPDDADEKAALISQAHRWLDRFSAHAPDFAAVHPLAVHGAEECDRLLQNAIASQHLVDMVDAPAYADWFYHHRLDAVYADYARQLQILTPPGDYRRWVLKSPAHLAHLAELLAALPGAVIVHCHRDPAEAVASYASLMATVRRPNTDHLALPHVGEQALRHATAALTAGWHARQHLDGDRVFDLSYPALAGDPIGEMARLYHWLDAPLDDATAAAMRRWLAANPHQHAAHRYDPHDFNLPPHRVHAAVADYCHHFTDVLTGR